MILGPLPRAVNGLPRETPKLNVIFLALYEVVYMYVNKRLSFANSRASKLTAVELSFMAICVGIKRYTNLKHILACGNAVLVNQHASTSFKVSECVSFSALKNTA